MKQARVKDDAPKPLRFTDESIATLPYARGARGVYVARDTQIIGFRCIVNRNSKRLVYQGESREGGKRRTVYKRLGNPEYVKVGEARARALEELARLERLTDPDAKAGTAFGQAWNAYKARLTKKKRSDLTIADYQQKFTAHLEPTFGKIALRDITRSNVTRLHDRTHDRSWTVCSERRMSRGARDLPLRRARHGGARNARSQPVPSI